MAEAKNKYVIPVTVQLNAGLNEALNQVEEPSIDGTPEQASTPQRLETPRSAMLDALNAGFLIDSTKKVLSATGNTQASMAIEVGAKVGTAVAGMASGNPAAMLGLIMDVVAEALTKIQELKAEAITNNNTKVNNIRVGATILGTGRVTTSRDAFGNIKYYTN